MNKDRRRFFERTNYYIISEIQACAFVQEKEGRSGDWYRRARRGGRKREWPLIKRSITTLKLRQHTRGRFPKIFVRYSQIKPNLYFPFSFLLTPFTQFLIRRKSYRPICLLSGDSERSFTEIPHFFIQFTVVETFTSLSPSRFSPSSNKREREKKISAQSC